MKPLKMKNVNPAVRFLNPTGNVTKKIKLKTFPKTILKTYLFTKVEAALTFKPVKNQLRSNKFLPIDFFPAIFFELNKTPVFKDPTTINFVPPKFLKKTSRVNLKTSIPNLFTKIQLNPLRTVPVTNISNYQRNTPYLMYNDVIFFNLYKFTSSRFALHSKKASIITTLIDLATSLNTQPVYLTTSQHLALKNVYKIHPNQYKIKQYTKAVFYRQNRRLTSVFLKQQNSVLLQNAKPVDIHKKIHSFTKSQSNLNNLFSGNVMVTKVLRTSLSRNQKLRMPTLTKRSYFLLHLQFKNFSKLRNKI